MVLVSNRESSEDFALPKMIYTVGFKGDKYA